MASSDLHLFRHLSGEKYFPDATLPAGSIRKSFRRHNRYAGTKANPKLTLTSPNQTSHRTPPLECLDVTSPFMSPKMARILREASRSLERGKSPKLAPEGLGGTYFLSDRKSQPIAVFKPCDEEHTAANNPKAKEFQASLSPQTERHIRAGEAAMRECAAFLLDHGHFAGVPETTLVRSTHTDYFDANEHAGHGSREEEEEAKRSHSVDSRCVGSPHHGGEPSKRRLKEKIGALQEYVKYDCCAEDIGPSSFSVSDVHRIAILDVRLCNTDRHAGNILVQWVQEDVHDRCNGGEKATGPVKSARLIPIDHGFCLPEQIGDVLFDWHLWPQAKVPFSPEELEYIERLDPDADIELLKRQLPGLRSGSFRTLKICTILLKEAARAGLTLYDIANIMMRTGLESPRSVASCDSNSSYSSIFSNSYSCSTDDWEEPSILERLVATAEAVAAEKTERVRHMMGPEEADAVSEKYFYKAITSMIRDYCIDRAAAAARELSDAPSP